MKNKILNVPLLKQKKDTCGPTALRMIFKYFGKEINEKEIIKFIGGLRKYGVRTIALADYAKYAGYQSKCFSFNEKAAGGKAEIERPNVKRIEEYLSKGVPVILLVRSFLLFNKKPSPNGHFIVITGYKNGIFFYNDPKDGQRHKISKEELLFIWFNNVLEPSAYFVAIWPKKS